MSAPASMPFCVYTICKYFFSLLFLFVFHAPNFSQIDLRLELFATGLANPVDIESRGDEFLFVVEKRGTIKILDFDGSLASITFLDISGRVNDGASERGLLGMVFHPDYWQNGYFFVNYTNAQGNTTISRFTAREPRGFTADPASEKILLTIPQPRSNHNAGDLNFGPDGYLYFGLGDGGSAGDPWNNSQTTSTLLGKMIRIDVDSGNPYAIPADNPFVDSTGYQPEIWAQGLRNPWRFSFDQYGNMWIADVGQDSWEEINFEPVGSAGGLNYGWSCYEGNDDYLPNRCNRPKSDYTFPAAVYRNDFTNGCSVTGGYRYRGCAYPRLYDRYIFTDYCTGKFWSVVVCDADTCAQPYILEELANFQDQEFVSFGENFQGELFLAAIRQGRIYRLVEQNEEIILPVITDDSNSTLSVPPLFSNYQWYLDGQPLANSTGPEIQILDGGYYWVEVTTPYGCTVRSATYFIAETTSVSQTQREAFRVRVAPNPFSQSLNLHFSNSTFPLQLSITDCTGKAVFRKEFFGAGQSLELTEADLWPPGLYIVVVEREGIRNIQKVVKLGN